MSGYQDEEKKALEDIRRWDEESVVYFSNRRKPLRERNVVKTFLRICGIEFTNDEVKSCGEDPPDVLFREARFEVVDLLDKDRERRRQFKERAVKSKAATSLAEVCHDLHEEPDERFPLEFPELLGRIEQLIDKKHKKLKSRKDRVVDFGTLDLLIYVSLENHHVVPPLRLDCPSQFLTKVRGQGWRSVSFFMNVWAGVILSKVDAPNFIKNLKGRPIFVQDAQVASSLWEN